MRHKIICTLLVMALLITSVAFAAMDKPLLSEASYQDLIALEDIGPVLANRIIDYIKINPDYSIDDIILIKSIGSLRMKTIKRNYR